VSGWPWNGGSKLLCCRRLSPFLKLVSHTRSRLQCGSLPLHSLSCKLTHPYPVSLLVIGLRYFQAKRSPIYIPQLFSNLVIIYLHVYEDGTECSERSQYKIQTPGNYPQENIEHTEHGKILKSRIQNKHFTLVCF
jgi:hypothetical protein